MEAKLPSLQDENTLKKKLGKLYVDRRYDTIIDLHTMTYFDGDDNEWKPIKGSEEDK